MKVTLLQSRLSWENRTENLTRFSAKIAALNEATDLIVLPEMFTSGFTMNKEDCFDTMNGETLVWMKKSAFEKNAAICGSAIIKEDQKFFNRFLFVAPSGETFCYNKKHLFGMSGEDQHYTAGTENTIIHYKGWRIKPQVCYDLRFPVWARNTPEQHFDLLLYVACWPEKRSHHWRSLLPARAIENQCYVVAANRVGEDGNGINHTGDSCVINALGEMVLTGLNEEAALTASLDINHVRDVRQRLPFLKDADSFALNE